LDAFRRMSENETGRVLVFDRGNPKKLVGVVTKTDLMHTLTKQYTTANYIYKLISIIYQLIQVAQMIWLKVKLKARNHLVL
jgi:signal-transduction protein with cAMP-binding, CBS, and nucleotidyltransferase domain